MLEELNFVHTWRTRYGTFCCTDQGMSRSKKVMLASEVCNIGIGVLCNLFGGSIPAPAFSFCALHSSTSAVSALTSLAYLPTLLVEP